MNTYAHILSGSAYRLGTVSATTEMRVSFPQEEIVASSTSYTYNSAGQPTHVESYINDELVSTTIMSYDSAGRLTMRKSAPRGSRVYVGDEYGYSSSTGLLDSSWDEYGRWTEYMSCDKYGNPAWLWNENEYWRTDFSYDAWGRTRSVSNWDLYEYSDPQTLLYRGYAGYPFLQTLGLYHASARIYDPLTGRFLGYDPVVQDPFNSQNFNKYSYCLNNPFRYTDPDGKFVFSLFLGPVGAILDAACWGAVIGGSSYALGVAFSEGSFQNWDWSSFGTSAGWGAISGAATFGLGEAFASFGDFAGRLGTEAIRGIAHGTVQGGLSSLQGGDFWSGFISGTIGSYTSSCYSTLGLDNLLGDAGMIGFSSLTSGIGSYLSGGSFWEGSATGAMIGGLNHIQHKTEEYKFFGKLRRHYERANGEDYILSKMEFEYLVKKGVLKGDVTSLDNNIFKQQMVYYDSGCIDLAYSFGTSPVLYTYNDSQISYLGFHDEYNFDSKPWGERNMIAELATRIYGFLSSGVSYNIYYNKALWAK